MKRPLFARPSLLALLLLLTACSAKTSTPNSFEDDEPQDEPKNEGGAGGEGSSISQGGADAILPSTGGATGVDCISDENDDGDGDGFTDADGDCNDCDPNVNPNAIEVFATDGNSADEDCDGEVDNLPNMWCDPGIVVDSADPADAARALGICNEASADGPNWGLVDVKYIRADGTQIEPTNQVGILENFGPNVQPFQATRILSLSTGRARVEGQEDACESTSCNGTGWGTAPSGFPQDVSGCPGDTNINDDIGLELTLRAPSNATGFSFVFAFYSHEYPEYVCSSYNDQFVAIVSPEPEGSLNGNVSFDSANNPVSVNVAFFDVCQGCQAGTDRLEGTGFDSSEGATSWLKSVVPIEGGQEFTIRFLIWDTGDSALDSTVILDEFKWIANSGTVAIHTGVAE